MDHSIFLQIEAIFAIKTLYDTRGDQITQFGYVAFGLTVAPYATMSLINLFGGLMTPQYPCLYMVESSIMDEARRRPDCYFQGTVGCLAEVGRNALTHLDGEEHHFQFVGPPVSFDEVDDALKGTVFISNNDEEGPLQNNNSDIEMDLIQHPQEAVVLQVVHKHETQSLATDNRNNRQLIEGEARLIPELLQDGTILFVPDSSCTRRRSNLPKLSSRFLSRVIFSGRGVDHLFDGSDNFMYKQYNGSIYCAALLVYVSLGVIGGLSKFRNGNSTSAQRGWTMSWWVFGVIAGIGIPMSNIDESGEPLVTCLCIVYKLSQLLGVLLRWDKC